MHRPTEFSTAPIRRPGASVTPLATPLACAHKPLCSCSVLVVTESLRVLILEIKRYGAGFAMIGSVAVLSKSDVCSSSSTTRHRFLGSPNFAQFLALKILRGGVGEIRC